MTESKAEVAPAIFNLQRPGRITERPTVDTGTESKVWQASKNETDVNVIMANYVRTGAMTSQNNKTPMYGDFTMKMDLQQAFKLSEQAREGFMSLPPNVRALANNDPVKFVEMMQDRNNWPRFAQAGMPFEYPNVNAGPAKAQPEPASKEPAGEPGGTNKQTPA